MSAINYAVKQLMFRIPKQILDIAFKDQTANSWRMAPVSLEELIISNVLKPRVLTDANLVGGITSKIPINNLNMEIVDFNSVLIRIPEDRLNNKEILSVISVSLFPFNSYSGVTMAQMVSMNNSGINSVVSAAGRIGDAMSNVPVVTSTSVELVGYNTIIVRNQVSPNNLYELKCVLANNSDLSNINPRSWPNFAKLCELAVKSYIYNTLIIKLDQSYLVGGMELGAVKSYVDNLADSEEMYQTELKEVWGVTAFCNDSVAYEEFIRSQLNIAL